MDIVPSDTVKSEDGQELSLVHQYRLDSIHASHSSTNWTDDLVGDHVLVSNTITDDNE